MIADCAVGSGLSRRHQRFRRVAVVTDERPGQRRGNLGPAPPTRSPTTTAGFEQGQVRPREPGLPRGTAQTPPPRLTSSAASDRQPGHGAAMAPRSDAPTPRQHLPASTNRTPAHGRLDPATGTAPGPGKPELGIPPCSRRAGHPGHQGRRLDHLGDPQRCGLQPRTRAHGHHLGRVPAQPSRRAAGMRLHRNVHIDRPAPIHPGLYHLWN